MAGSTVTAGRTRKALSPALLVKSWDSFTVERVILAPPEFWPMPQWKRWVGAY
jgi:hypothetical protein